MQRRICFFAVLLISSLMLLLSSLPMGSRSTCIPVGNESHGERLLPAFSLAGAGFQRNMGQWEPGILFLAKWNAGSVAFKESEVVLVFEKWNREEVAERTSKNLSILHAGSRIQPAMSVEQTVIRMQFVGANRRQPSGDSPKDITINSFIGNDERKWKTSIPAYDTVRYENLYDGIDLTFFFTAEGVLKYEYTVHPGSDYRKIQVRYEGTDDLAISGDGKLELITASELYFDDKPLSFVTKDNKTKELQSRYSINDGTVSYLVDNYYNNGTLVIDPGFSTYIGWEGSDGLMLKTKYNDSLLCFCGSSNTLKIPVTMNAIQKDNKGKLDGLVLIYNYRSHRIEYLTYLGGSEGASNEGITKVIPDGNELYIVGITDSRDFPVTENAFQNKYGGGSADCFVARLMLDSCRLRYCSFIGGTGYDGPFDFELLPEENALVIVGITDNVSFPRTSGAAQRQYRGGDDDSFIAKLSKSGDSLAFSTLLGGNGYDEILCCDIDEDNDIYVCGYTTSTNFPVRVGALQDTLADMWGDCFITKLCADGSEFVLSTYFGGTSNDRADAIILMDKGVYLTGLAGSLDFPTSENAYQKEKKSQTTDGFVSKLSKDLSKMIYSTYIGGTNTTELDELIHDRHDNVIVAGDTYSADFPATNTAPYKYNQGKCDLAVAIFDSTLSNLRFATMYGGTESEFCTGLIIDNYDNLYIAGVTKSKNFPVSPNAYQETYGGGSQDGILIMLPPEVTLVNTRPIAEPPTAIDLGQCYPNPALANEQVRIPYTVNGSGRGSLAIYNAAGRMVHESMIEHRTPGSFTESIPLPDLAGGLYFYTFVYNGSKITRKMLIR